MTRRSRFVAGHGLCAALFFALVSAACTLLQPPPVENVSLFVLSPAPPSPSPAPRRDVAIEVAPPRAWAGFDTTQIAYAHRPYELEYFAASRWVDTPPRMLAPLLVRALEQSGGFQTVVQAPSSVASSYRVDTEIVRLVQNFSVTPSRTELVMRAQLTEVRTNRVVATRVFEVAEDAPSENAAGGAAAANGALHRMLEQVADFCVVGSTSR
jgi:cholesterol transport system auxiliary component